MAFGSIYTGTTGLLTFSKGLDTISNNVANLNTVGYKRNDLLFRDLFYQLQVSGQNNEQPNASWLGQGVTDGGTVTSFAQGEIQDTGNDTDVAIAGNGFFILRRDNDTFYTRGGQFSFDDDGFLVSNVLNSRVAGIDASEELVDISIAGLRTSPAQATNRVTFFNNLSTGSSSHVIDDLDVIDSVGEVHSFTVNFTNNSAVTPRSWLVEVEDESAAIVTSGQEIRFQANGSPEVGFNEFIFSYQPGSASAANITFNFGAPGSFAGATSFSSGSTSTLAVDDSDGIELGSLLGLSFDREGLLTINYSNGASEIAGRLGLAWFDALQSLQQIGNGLFLVDDSQEPVIGTAAAGVMGEIVSNSIEISNVELSQEFTDLIIVQRGFQASSQVVSVANEMIQQLLDISGGR
ncbi:MAG: flagellar basal-body rod protein FlgF [Gammaproteobacteria bacterium]|nr:flagellar basal-body rod protein FlgF [Gammaproteobacteria bacterium]